MLARSTISSARTVVTQAGPSVVRCPAPYVVRRSVSSASFSRSSSRPSALYTPDFPGTATQRRWKSKRSSAQYIDPDAAQDDDVPVMKTKGKGSKHLRGTSSPKGTKSKSGEAEQDSMDYKTSTRNQDLPDEAFDLTALQTNMKRAVERCKTTISSMVGSFGRADPSLLDNIRVESPSTSGPVPLRDLATVGVRDGALIINVFDQDMIKHIERSIYTSNQNLTPQVLSPSGSGNDTSADTYIRVAVPKPTSESRAALVKDLTKICENAKVSIRSARHQGQKQIKSDIDRKVVGKSEGDKELKKLEAETKKSTAEVDSLFEKMKSNLLSPQ